jgi:hypothetical protein
LIPLQLHQNINLFLLLIVGSFVAHIYLGWVDIVAILAFTIFVEHLLLYFNKRRDFYFSYSAFSTAIGVIVLMYSPHLYIYFIVITLGLFQKHFITFKGKQFFNPSNFALIMALLFFYKDAHIISGQFGDELWLTLVVSFVAIIILIRVNRWIIPLAFIGSYLLLQYLLIVNYDPVILFEDIYHRLYSVTFVLFIYFMLTDPPVTPSKWYEQIGFAFAVALMATLLDRFDGYRVQHLFMAVFFFSIFVNLLKVEKDFIALLKLTAIILFFTIATLSYIEMQTPYYFEMEG